MVELVDTPDLKSCGPQGPCGFDSRCRYQNEREPQRFPFSYSSNSSKGVQPFIFLEVSHL